MDTTPKTTGHVDPPLDHGAVQGAASTPPASLYDVPPASAPRIRIGWHPVEQDFVILADDDPGYVVRIKNLRSAHPIDKRVPGSHEKLAQVLLDAEPAEIKIAGPRYEAYRQDRRPALLAGNYLRAATEARAAMEQRFHRVDYIRRRELPALCGFADGSDDALVQARRAVGGASLEQAILDHQGAAREVPGRIQAHNERYLRARLEQCGTFFDTVEEKPLTACQRRAVVMDEDRHLVLAGAGTGKTSTIVARVAYLIRYQAVPPAQILVLAYSKDVDAEIRARLARRGVHGVEVKTFHAFGKSVIAAALGHSPPVSSLATQATARHDLIRGVVARLRATGPGQRALVRFLVEERYSVRSESTFTTLGEYLAATRRPRYLTPDGRFRVKSAAEVRIANWLCAQGVKYEYEPRYPHVTPSREHSGYRPDFLLPEYGIYIEHFGVDRHGQTAPHVNRDNYLAGIEWKTKLHETYGTPLVTTFSYQTDLLGELKRQLSERGVRFVPRSDRQLLELALKHRATPFVRLVDDFLTRFRDNLWTMERVRASSGYAADPMRTAAFLDVFEPVLRHYERTLAATGEVDFSMMVGLASEAIRDGTFTSRYTHVVVDEFQDISPARYGLVQALLDQPGAERHLFAVGDDWQSIYRFSGSDVGLMTDTDGDVARTPLDRTFRFSDRLAELSRTFISQNPAQIDKPLLAQPGEGPAATVIHASDADGLRTALNAIRTAAGARKASVYVLTRFNLTEAREHELVRVGACFPGLSIEWKTVHKSKGLEADFVVVLGMSAGYYGFPSEVANDPLLRLLIAAEERFPHAEERRLFYVALTRARTHVYLVAPPDAPSPFVAELLAPTYAGLVKLVKEGAEVGTRPVCAVCRTGTLVRSPKGGAPVWTCSNHPGCDRRVPPCRVCGQAPLVRDGNRLRCASPACTHRERMCPRCGGELRERVKNGHRFLGCSEWRPHDAGCFFTEALSPVGKDVASR